MVMTFSIALNVIDVIHTNNIISQTARITRYCLGSIRKSLAKEIQVFTCVIGPVTIFAAR